MVALIDAAKADDFPAEIALVVSNEPAAQGLDRARAAGIATAVVDHRPYGKDREAFERALQAAIEPHQIDLICLAGFMRLLTPWFIAQWDGAASQHPSGAAARLQGPRHPCASARCRRQGARRNRAFRSARNGFGPIIVQEAVPVLPDDTEASLAAACSRSSIGFIRRRCAWSQKAAVAESR